MPLWDSGVLARTQEHKVRSEPNAVIGRNAEFTHALWTWLELDRISENWRKFPQRFTLYLEALGYTEKEAKVQSSLLLHVACEEAQEFLHVLFCKWGGTTTFGCHNAEVWNITQSERELVKWMIHVFHVCPGRLRLKSVSPYATELRTKAKSFDFGALESSPIRDWIVCGINSNSMRETSLREVDISLEETKHFSIRNDQGTAKQMREEDKHVQKRNYVDAVKERHKAQRNDKRNI